MSVKKIVTTIVLLGSFISFSYAENPKKNKTLPRSLPTMDIAHNQQK
jgi:hypothetical protein